MISAVSQLLMMASMAMGGTDAVVTNLKPMLAGFGKELVNTVRVTFVIVAVTPASNACVLSLLQFIAKFDPKAIIDVKAVRGEIDQLLTEKLEFLSAVRVKKAWRVLSTDVFRIGVPAVTRVVPQLVEDVIRNHLGWLIVWGNVFGASMDRFPCSFCSSLFDNVC